MPERETPAHDSAALPGDLFANLPAPTQQIPTVDSSPPAPGSRRARREAGDSPTDAPSPTEDAAAPDDDSADAAPATMALPVAPGRLAEETAATPRPASDPVTPVSATVPASLDDLFIAEPESARPKKKKRRTGCLVAMIIVLVLVGGAAAGGIWVWNTYGDRISEALGWGEPPDWEPGMATGETFVTINENDTGAPVSVALHEAGVTKTEDVFYDYLIAENIAMTFYPGVYRLQEKMTAAAARDALMDEANRMENTVGITEGGTVDTAVPVIAESIGLPLADVQAAVADPRAYGVEADSLEGWLFPAVYTFDPEVTAPQIIQRMVDRTRESLAAAGVPAGDEQRVLTIASIIQREGRLEDFAKVSRVIQNRLDDGMLLQMDSTSQYGYGELHAGVVSTSEEAQFDDNPWNTYVHPGLPIGPIANSGDAAIAAAMSPADGPWFYFVTTNPQTGETTFSTTYEEHLAAIDVWHAWCRENPDQGC